MNILVYFATYLHILFSVKFLSRFAEIACMIKRVFISLLSVLAILQGRGKSEFAGGAAGRPGSKQPTSSKDTDPDKVF
jgi:hypothetical protein